jgi:outer membrane protein assembly factor BamD (BamD/ComL family)
MGEFISIFLLGAHGASTDAVGIAPGCLGLCLLAILNSRRDHPASHRTATPVVHPVLLPILVGCATALVIGLGFRGGQSESISAHQAPSGDVSTQAFVPVYEASPIPDNKVAVFQFLQSDCNRSALAGHEHPVPAIARAAVKAGPQVGQEEFDAAHKLFGEEEYAAARKALKKILKKYRKRNLPVEEDVMFYLAECDFQLAQYPGAQDGYDELLRRHGATRYFDLALRRLFAIGRYWLNAPMPASEVELASFTDEDGEERRDQVQEVYDPGESPLKLNFTDKSRPFIDTPGRAVQALRAVCLQDPSGALADDSVMILALYNLRKQDYEEANIYFSQIRECYPKSECLQAAYVLGAHACWKSYLESRNDGKRLEEARKLTKAAIRLFPDVSQRPQLESILREMDADEIEREWERVVFYKNRGEKDPVVLYCEMIVKHFRDSGRAAEARELLIEMKSQPSADILPAAPFEPNNDGRNPKPAAPVYGEPK